MWFPLHRNMRPLPARVSREVPRSILKFEMLLGTLDATPKFPNIPVSLQGNTEVPGVSWEVPCSALKGETVLDTLDATAKVPRHAGFPRGEHRGSRHHFIWDPSPFLIATGESIPLRGLEGVPGLPGAPQDEAGLRRKFETSHVWGATCRTTPIFRSALDKKPMPGYLFEGNPVGEGITRRGTDTPVHHPEKPAGSTHSSTRGLRLPEQLERQPEFHSSDKTRHDSPVPTLQGPCSRSPKPRNIVEPRILRVRSGLSLDPLTESKNKLVRASLVFKTWEYKEKCGVSL